jgi:crotonobetainyl-CoA:carnitine CoA-transferase CaiB-like acyl-CoA transferase
VVGTHEFPAVPLRFGAQATPRPPAPAPTLGEHNAEVLRDLLGMSDDEIARLRAIGVIGERPLGL